MCLEKNYMYLSAIVLIMIVKSNTIMFRASTLDVTKKIYHFATSNVYFIILPHHFTTSYLSDILLFNSIH